MSIGGDSDTLAAITGGIAEAYYGIPAGIRKHALTFLDENLLKILVDFSNGNQGHVLNQIFQAFIGQFALVRPGCVIKTAEHI